MAVTGNKAINVGRPHALTRPPSLGAPSRRFRVFVPRPTRAVVPARRRVVCQLTDKGRSIGAQSIQVKSPLGEGSYGQVYEGWLQTGNGQERVVLKRVKSRVEGAAEMGQMEHLLNVYAYKTARGSVASFVGYAQVRPEEATRNLTEGLWLLWKYEGNKTLAHYLRRRDCVQRLAADLGVSDSAAIPTVMQHIFEGLAGLHAAGLVHRDVKPLNIIFAEEERRFKLIDLGACADLRTGTNYTPDESILDPTYCPPEQYCMPTDSPHLAKQLKPLAMAMSPVLWSRFKPDRFDSYSCGLVLLQLALPKLRSAAGMRQFNDQMRRLRYDLAVWRESERPRDAGVLDAEGGAGWDLAAALLRPRDIQVDERGGVGFVNKGGAIRLPIKAALRHRFLKQAREEQSAKRRQGTGSTRGSTRRKAAGTMTAPTPTPRKTGSGLLAGALSAWNAASSRLMDLEAKLSNQERAVAMQTGKVEVLREDVAKGRVAKEVLDRQQGLLSKMTGRLNRLQKEVGTTAAGARNVLQGFMGPDKPASKLSNQARAVAAQQGKVEVLRAGFATGKIKQADLARAEGLLQKMTRRLGTLQDEFGAAASSPQRFFDMFQPRQRTTTEEVQAQPPPPQIKQGGSFLQSLLRSNRAEKSQRTEDTEEGSTVTRSRTSGSGTSGTDVRSDLPPSLKSAPVPDSPGGTGTTQQQAGGQTAALAAVTGLYAGLKLTGLALRVATDMATSLTKDANAAFAAGEADRNAKRDLRRARAAFLELLRAAEPPVRADSRWGEVRRVLVKDARFNALDEAQRSALFAEYTAELARVQQARLQRSEDTFRELLAEVGLLRGSTLESVEALLAGDPRYESLPEGLDKRGLFTASMVQARPEFDFWELLDECNDPVLNRRSTWSQARRQIVTDPRFAALASERRRKVVFRRFVDTLDEPEEEQDPVAASKQSLTSLQALKAEQDRLRREYERMAAELQEVEKRLQGSAQVGQDLRPTAKDINGNVTDLVSRGPSN